MGKVVRILTLILINLTLLLSNPYQSNCLKCHRDMVVGIDKFFYRYLLIYSSEREVKEALFEYMKNPTESKSTLAKALLNRFGVKAKTTLSDKELREAIDIYWDIYKVFGKLR